VYALVAALAYPWSYGLLPDRDGNNFQKSIVETAAENLQLAKWGYWGSTGNRRWAQTEAEMALIDTLRREIASGRITPATHVAHLTPFIRLFEDVVLFSVYTGINDDPYITNYVPDPSVVGGRIRPIETFAHVLEKEPPTYIVVHHTTINGAHVDDGILAGISFDDYDALFDRDGVRLLRRRTSDTRASASPVYPRCVS
jgi:hypothetical protein